MKTYTIQYEHITGHETQKTTVDPNELSKWLEDALFDAYVTDSSIVINTEDRE